MTAGWRDSGGYGSQLEKRRRASEGDAGHVGFPLWLLALVSFFGGIALSAATGKGAFAGRPAGRAEDESEGSWLALPPCMILVGPALSSGSSTHFPATSDYRFSGA